MMEYPDAGHFYDLRMRLRRYLSIQRRQRAGGFTAPQEEVWLLLNEVEQLVKLLERSATLLEKDNGSEFAYQVRHSLACHSPRWKSK